jgi:hypothetical protein
MDIQQMKTMPSKKEQARNAVILSLHFNKKLTDEFLPPEEMDMLMNKDFQEWTPELQAKLRHYGAAMIQ